MILTHEIIKIDILLIFISVQQIIFFCEIKTLIQLIRNYKFPIWYKYNLKFDPKVEFLIHLHKQNKR